MSVSGTEKKGPFSQIKDTMGNTLDKLLSLPDKPEHPTAKKAARIFANILVIGLGVIIFGMVTRFNLATLANPSLTTLMAMPLSLAISGVGISWLLNDILAKKMHRTASKIMAILMPITLAAGAACLIAAGFHGGFSPLSMGGYWFVGLLLVPLAFFAVDHAIETVGQREEAVFLRRKAPEVKNDERVNARRKEAMRRSAESQGYTARLRSDKPASLN